MTTPPVVFVLTYCDPDQYQGACGFRGVYATEAAARRKLNLQVDQMIVAHDDDMLDLAAREYFGQGFHIAELEVLG